MTSSSEEYLDNQKKVFTRWINARLCSTKSSSSPITDICYDLRSGVVLLSLVSALTGQGCIVDSEEAGAASGRDRDEAALRVHKLGNISRVVGLMQREHVNTDDIDIPSIVEGDTRQTLRLVWKIIFRWQIQSELQARYPHLQSATAEQILAASFNRILATSVKYSDSTTRLASIYDDLWDGEIFCRILLGHRPNYGPVENALGKPPPEKLDTILRLANEVLGVPGVLDLQDLVDRRVDKKCLLLYSVLFLCSLPPVELSVSDVSHTSTEVEEGHSIGLSTSPVKTPTRIRMKDRDTFTVWAKHLEEVLSWLLEAEEHLLSLNSLGQKHLDTVKTKFYNHEDLMLELKNHQAAVGEVLERGEVLLDASNDTTHQDEIRLQMKVLKKRWGSVRELASKKQAELHDLVMKLQMKELTKLRQWMSTAEERISRFGSLGDNLVEVGRQLEDMESLQQDLEGQYSAVSAISNFILVDTEDSSDLEDELTGLGERWGMICRCTEERQTLLQTVFHTWTEAEREGHRMQAWLKGIENVLKEMELQQNPDSSQLQDQVRRISATQEEIAVEEGKLTSLNECLSRLLANLGPEHSAHQQLTNLLESIQDRWDVLLDILEAQKQRISNLGIELHQSEAGAPTLSGTGEPSQSQTRKAAGTKRIQFETGFAKVSGWADHILSRLVEGETRSFELEDQNLLYEETEAEVNNQKDSVETLCSLGLELVKDIEQAGDFPPDYLHNITSKIETVRSSLQQIQSALTNLNHRIDFNGQKSRFVKEFADLDEAADKWIHSVSELPADSSNQAFRESLSNAHQEWKHLEEQHRTVGQLSATLTANPGAEPEFISTAKCDIEQIEKKIGEAKARLSSLTRITDADKASSKSCDSDVEPDSTSQSVGPISDQEEGNRSSGPGDDSQAAQINGQLKAVPGPNAKLDAQPATSHYEEIVVSSTIVLPSPRIAKTEVFLNMNAYPKGQSDRSSRDVCNLEHDLERCHSYLNERLELTELAGLDDELRRATSYLDQLNEPFIPASVSEDESNKIVTQLMETKSALRARIGEVRALKESIDQYQEEISGLSLWMSEVETFLEAEDAAFGDLETLDAQLRESNALQDDIATLQPNVTTINLTGQELVKKCKPGTAYAKQMQTELETVNQKWNSITTAAAKQNTNLKVAHQKSSEVLELLNDINNFLDQLEQDLPVEGVVTQAPELSQRTYKLLQLRDKTERKSSMMDRLSSTLGELLESDTEGSEDRMASINNRVNEVQTRWNSLTQPVSEQYNRMKEASSDYGEFKTLVAQESDWLDRLEKKLRRSSKCAADAEEISEELDDLENCLHNHPTDRLSRLKVLASGLSEKDVLISPVESEAQRLANRRQELERMAKERIRTLEECIAEAQEWECKILAVQDWLSEKDILLTSHLEHELTVDDLPDETQKERMLREFEEKENILSEMDEQVDAYRVAGKEEAAARLEDQLALIHSKFQELSSKFELFQRPSDYEGRLCRISRQLRDIQHNMYLTELISHEPDSIHGQLHHTRCIYNALADIKPEVEATIKMGRKLVESCSVADPPKTTKNIDSLKELFNLLGAQVTEAREVLEKALGISEVLVSKLNLINTWISEKTAWVKTANSTDAKGTLQDMKRKKLNIREILSIKQEFTSLCADPSLLVSLNDALSNLEANWRRLQEELAKRLPDTERGGLNDLNLSEDESQLYSPVFRASQSSTGEETVALQEFRTVFQEITAWIEKAEQILERERRASQDRQLTEQLQSIKPKVESLGEMAVKIVERFSDQREEVEPEMVTLEDRWDRVVSRIQAKSSAPGGDDVTAVGIETSATTLDDLTGLNASCSDEIVTLPEEGPSFGGDSMSESINVATINELKSAGPPRVDTAEPKNPRSSNSEKTPPPVLPKPKWYVESLAESPSLSSTSPNTAPTVTTTSTTGEQPVQQVRVTVATLPSPRTLPPQQFKVRREKSASPKVIQPEKAVLPASIDSPTTETAPKSVLDAIDRQNEKDQKIIDSLLRGTTTDIEEVKARTLYSSRGYGSRDSGQSYSKEIREFEEKCSSVTTKLNLARNKISQLEQDLNINLRNDLIEMEMQQLEAEVATTISRGDTLVLMIHRFDASKGDLLQKEVSNLRNEWTAMKSMAENIKSSGIEEAKTEKALREKIKNLKNDLRSSLDEVQREKSLEIKQKMAKKGASLLVKAVIELEGKEHFIKLPKFKGSLLESWNDIQSMWAELKNTADLIPQERKSKSKSPKEILDRAVPAEMFAKTSKMLDALTAVQNQLDTSIMKGRKYESLAVQSELLDKVSKALETLRPKVKKVLSDVELMSGSLSMEYFDKLTAMCEKLRQEWGKTNEAFTTRANTWRECDADLQLFYTDSDTIEKWLALKEDFLHQQKQDNASVSKVDIKCLGRELETKEVSVERLEKLGAKISQESGVTQAKEVTDRHANIRKRWRFLYTEISNFEVGRKSSAKDGDQNAVKLGNINLITAWADDALASSSQNFNVSELEELKDGIHLLQSLQITLVNNKSALEELAGHSGENAQLYQKSRIKLEKIGQLIPKRLSYLIEKSERLVKMVEEVESFRSWINAIKERSEPTSQNKENNISLRMAISDKEYSINKLFNDYYVLEREVTTAGLKVNTSLVEEVTSLKNKWLSLSSDVRRLTPTIVPPPPTNQIPKTNSSHSVSSYISLGSLTSPSSQSSEAWAASPTTASTSPMSEEIMPVNGPELASIEGKLNKLNDWLDVMMKNVNEAKTNVCDTESVGKELDRLRSLLPQFEYRRQLKDELLKTCGDSDVNLKKDMEKLQLKWNSTHQAVMARKTELTAMFEHSDNLASKGNEITQWLDKLEGMLNPSDVGQTRDVLLKQIRDVNHVHRELQQYGHHITLFSQICQRLVSIYNRDSTGDITLKDSELSSRYSDLNLKCNKRGKALQTALKGLNDFDTDLAEFLAWIGEIEGLVERMESDGESVQKQRLEEIKSEIRERDRQFNSLSSKGKEQLTATGESDIILRGKIDELGRRWTALQNSVLKLTDKLLLQDQSYKRSFSFLLDWTNAKSQELKDMCVPEALPDILKQQEQFDALQKEMTAKEEDINKLRPSEKITNSEEMKALEDAWKQLQELSKKMKQDINEAESKTRNILEKLDYVEADLAKLEMSSGEWELPPCLDTAQTEREDVNKIMDGLYQLEETVMSVKLETNVRLGSDVSSRLSAVERRLTGLKELTESRKEQLSRMLIHQEPGTQEFLKESVPDGYERCLTKEKIPYFCHHDSESTSWDHPEFDNLQKTISSMNTVKFCAYRLALKLRKVQQKLCLDLLDIASAVVCFESHGLTMDKHDLTIAVPEMVTVLTSIFESLYQCEPEDINIPLCVDLCLNWLLNVYDSQRHGFVRVLSFKLGLVLLCRGPLTEKYTIMFELAQGCSTNSPNKLDKRRLGLLLYDCMQVPRYLGEIALFGGSNIEPSVRSCLQGSGTEPKEYADLPQFLKWLSEEPQSLVWLPVLHRLSAAENATHDVKCKVCRMEPIIGFRYHCRRCFNLDMCHNCFFVGRTVKGHKPEHPMQEYCTSTTRTDNAKHLLQAFRNSFRSKRYFQKKQKKLGYLPVQTVAEGENFESPAMSPNLSLESRDFHCSHSESISSKLGHDANGSVDSRLDDDEHNLIAAYCRALTSNNNLPPSNSFLQDLSSRLDDLEKETIEQIIHQLQEENSRLVTEYKELQKGEVTNNSEEEKSLRQQKSRLEARLTILEDHNRQLEAQLERLRQLVDSEPQAGTLQSRFVVAAELHHSENERAGEEPNAYVRQPPMSAGKKGRSPKEIPRRPVKLQEDSNKRSSYRDSGTSGTPERSNRNSATSGSLNLSQHGVETQED